MCVQYMCGNTIQNNLIMCLCGPRFLRAWTYIHILCNLLCDTYGIATSRTHISGMATHMIVMHGTHLGTHNMCYSWLGGMHTVGF